MRIFFTTLLSSLLFLQSTAQTYIGTVLYKNHFEYIKISCDGGECTFSMPYIDGQKKYAIEGDHTASGKWAIQREFESWKFDTKVKNGKISGHLNLPNGNQKILLQQQLDGIPKDQLVQYEGTFKDSENQKVLVYSRFDYLHIMSPYAEETMSLKPIAPKTFWNTSGETCTYSNMNKGQYQTLHISNLQGDIIELQRIKSYTIEELWIPIDEDTLFAKLYLPGSGNNLAACLLLPGGGPVGMDNYEYEARLFAAHGIAALVFDKPGNGKSKGKRHFEQLNFEQKNDQYIRLFHFLRVHPRVNSEKVGVHGPSEGGRLALMMAIDLKDTLAFCNAVAAPIMTMKEGQLYAMKQHHRNMGIDEIDNLRIQQLWDEYYTGIIEGNIDPKTIEKANHYRLLHERSFLPPNSTRTPTSPKAEDLVNNRVVLAAKDIKCPILLQYGENDQRVHPAKSILNLTQHLSDQTKINVKIYPRGSHSVMTPEYKICPSFTDDKVKWLKHIGVL